MEGGCTGGWRVTKSVVVGGIMRGEGSNASAVSPERLETSDGGDTAGIM